MGVFRIINMGIKLAVRSKRRFVLSLITYTALLLVFAIVWQNPVYAAEAIPFMIILVSIILVLIYGLLISHWWHREVAVLKCVGWSNKDVFFLLFGELVVVIFLAMILVFEVSVHILGLSYYIPFMQHIGIERLKLEPVTMYLTFLIALLLTVIGLIVAWWRTLRIRPWMALLRR
ncbi:MAG: FtsX-like permease family protein [Candidatus Korarchaeota archaeon]